jgi:prolyl-tRNA editing enzyme YbaK/EbsC (Cys-tRNA(Pro) deacylase)
MDRRILNHETVYAAAGSSNAVFGIEPRRLQQLTDAELIDATE